MMGSNHTSAPNLVWHRGQRTIRYSSSPKLIYLYIDTEYGFHYLYFPGGIMLRRPPLPHGMELFLPGKESPCTHASISLQPRLCAASAMKLWTLYIFICGSRMAKPNPIFKSVAHISFTKDVSRNVQFVLPSARTFNAKVVSRLRCAHDFFRYNSGAKSC